MRKRLFLLPLILLGLYLVFLPQVNTALYQHETTVIIHQFEEHRAETAENERAHPAWDALWPELYQAMRDFNCALVLSQQASMTSPSVFEEASIPLGEYGPEEGSPVGTITIPAIDLQLPLYLGASEKNLSKGAAVLGQTSMPIGGESTNCVIAGHRGYRGIPYFRNLDRLQKGDTVILTNFWEQLTYEVESMGIIEPRDLDSIQIQEGRDLLTLLTCHPYTIGTQRLIIICKRM